VLDVCFFQGFVRRLDPLVNQRLGRPDSPPEQMNLMVEGGRVLEDAVIRRLNVEAVVGRMAEDADVRMRIEVCQGDLEGLRAAH
jgi:hypothetical protein